VSDNVPSVVDRCYLTVFVISLAGAFVIAFGCTRSAEEKRNLAYSTMCSDARELVRDYTGCAAYDYQCARQVRYARKTLAEERCSE
jgi:hypothetical protein